MPGKIDVYNLGELGVDTVKSPLHQSDGDLIQAQNAMPDPAGLEGGLKKRDGMTKLNAAALTGTIEGAGAIPLPAPSAANRRFYAGNFDALEPFYSSLGGSAGWAAVLTPSQPGDQSQNTVSGVYGLAGALSYRGRFYYAGVHSVGSEAPVLRVFDGTSDNELARIPGADTTSDPTTYYIGHLWIHRGVLYLTAGAAAAQHVFKVDLVTGAVTRVGEFLNPTTGNGALFGVAFLDRVFAGFFGDGGGGINAKIRWIRNGEDTWTVDRTIGAGDYRGYVHGAVFEGNLYVGTGGSVGTAPIVERRTPDGTWSTSLTAPDADVGQFGCFAVFNGELYCVYTTNAGGGGALVKKFDGSSWTTDLDVAGTFAFSGAYGIVATDDALFVAFTDFVLRRTTAGVWSKVIDLPNGSGALGFID